MKDNQNQIFMNKNVSKNNQSTILPEYIMETLTCVDSLQVEFKCELS